MLSDNKIELLWSELLQIDNIDKRKEIIYHDTFKSKPIYRVLAEQNPSRLFEIIGGDFSDVEKKNQATLYTYSDYIDEYDAEYDSDEEAEWDDEAKSIEHANETGQWEIIGVCTIEGPNQIKLIFEFNYCEGYIDGIKSTPYNFSSTNEDEFLFY